MAAMSCNRRPGSVPCERNAKATRRTTVNCHHMIGRDLPRTRGYTIPRHERDTCSYSQYITPLRSCKHNVLMRLSPCWTIAHAHDGFDSPPNGKYRKVTILVSIQRSSKPYVLDTGSAELSDTSTTICRSSSSPRLPIFSEI